MKQKPPEGRRPVQNEALEDAILSIQKDYGEIYLTLSQMFG